MSTPGSQYGIADVIFYSRTGEVKFEALVPLSQKLQEEGLQGFREIAVDQGMLFFATLREQNIHMWMAKVRFDLAMIWISRNNQVTAIESPVLVGDPNTYTHKGKAVLETLPDLARSIQVGDFCEIVPRAVEVTG